MFDYFKHWYMIIKPEDVIIPEEKVLNYLLVSKEKNDKSAFLLKLGFNRHNYTELIEEIINIASRNEAILSRTSEFGNLYRIEGRLRNNVVVTIWMEEIEHNKFRFVTLYPA